MIMEGGGNPRTGMALVFVAQSNISKIKNHGYIFGSKRGAFMGSRLDILWGSRAKSHGDGSSRISQGDIPANSFFTLGKKGI